MAGSSNSETPRIAASAPSLLATGSLNSLVIAGASSWTTISIWPLVVSTNPIVRE